mgnify:CR=1 FL=1
MKRRGLLLGGVGLGAAALGLHQAERRAEPIHRLIPIQCIEDVSVLPGKPGTATDPSPAGAGGSAPAVHRPPLPEPIPPENAGDPGRRFGLHRTVKQDRRDSETLVIKPT